MRHCLALFLLACSISADAAETWLLKLERWGNPSFMTLHFDARQGRIEGTLDGDALTGTRAGNDVTLHVTDTRGQQYSYQGAIHGTTMQGSADFPNTNSTRNARVQRPPPPRTHIGGAAVARVRAR